jgi:hypothetical protein
MPENMALNTRLIQERKETASDAVWGSSQEQKEIEAVAVVREHGIHATDYNKPEDQQQHVSFYK